jgi:hypothetical protein
VGDDPTTEVSEPTSDGAAPAVEHPRTLTLRGATVLGIGSMIGAGIFALLGEAGAVAGAAVWISFLIGGMVAMLLGYVCAKLGVRYPSSGGLITYLVKGFGVGRLVGVVSWLGYIAAIVIVTAMVAVSFGGYATALFVGEDANSAWNHLFITLLLLVMLALNLVGTKILAAAQSAIVIAVLGVFAIFVCVTVPNIDTSLLAFSGYPSASKIVASVALTFFAYLRSHWLLHDGGDCCPAEVWGSYWGAGQRVVEFVESSALDEFAGALGKRVGEIVVAVMPESACEKPVGVRRGWSSPDATHAVHLGSRDEARLIERDRWNGVAGPKLAMIGEVLDKSRGDLCGECFGEQGHQRGDCLEPNGSLFASCKGEEETTAGVVAAFEQPSDGSLGLRLRPRSQLNVTRASREPGKRDQPVREGAVHDHVLPLQRVDAEDEFGAVVTELAQELRESGAGAQSPGRRVDLAGYRVVDRAEVEAALELAHDRDQRVSVDVPCCCKVLVVAGQWRQQFA